MFIPLLIVCTPVNVLAPSVANGEQVNGSALSALPDAQALAAMLNVPLPVIGPPVNPAPLATLVTVPVPTAAHAHEVPVQCNTRLVAQVLVRAKFSVPLVPPPIRPLPLAVLKPAIPAYTMSNSGEWLVVVLSLLSKLAFTGL